MPHTDQRAHQLRLAIMRLARRMRLEQRDDSLTPSQLAVLGTLYRLGPRTPRELADGEHVRPPSMTRIIDSLVAVELIRRDPDPNDGRRWIVSINDAGRARIEAGIDDRQAWFNQRLDELDADTREAVLALAPVLEQMVHP